MPKKLLLCLLVVTIIFLPLFVACKSSPSATSSVPPIATSIAPVPSSASVPPPPAPSTPSTTPAQPPTTVSSPKTGGTLRIAFASNPTALGYPPKQAQGWTKQIAAPCIEALLHQDSSGKLIPWLATEYKNDSVAKTITLALRQGVKFHDGADFNAEAVKWNLDKSVSTKQMGTVKIKSVDVVDPFTVRITLTEWDNSVTDMLAYSYIGEMISPAAYQKNGEDWAINNPVGTGPFQFVNWVKDTKVVYKKFDGYWQKGQPNLDGIEINFIMDPIVRQLSFLNGENDVMFTPQYKDVESIQKQGYTIVTAVPYLSSPNGIISDAANPASPFSKLEVRQAMQYAIDPVALSKTVTFGFGEPASQWIFKGHWGYNPDIVGYPFNPAKAKELLSAAGFSNGIETKLTYFGTPENDLIFQAVAKMLNDVGIKATLAPEQMGRIVQLTFQGQQPDGLLSVGPPPYPDVAAGLRDRFFGDGKNYSKILAPDDYKQAVQNALSAPDFETKQKYTREALKLFTDKYAIGTYFYFNRNIIVYQKNRA